MSDASLRIDHSGAPRISIAAPSDYFALLKPRVMSLVVFTALTGVVMAPTPPNPIIAFASLLAIAVGAGASGALNMWFESDIDALMTRTRNRPIPSGRLARDEALAFGLVLAGMSVFTLGLVANWLAAGLLAFTIFFYVVIYTMWLKRATPLNIVIGGAAGALPPMVGFAAASGELGLSSLVLFAIISFGRRRIFGPSPCLRATITPAPASRCCPMSRDRIAHALRYASIGAGFGADWRAALCDGFCFSCLWAHFFRLRNWAGGSCAVATYREREGEAAKHAARRLFWFSIIYLFTLFLVLVVERVLHLTAFTS